MQLKTRVKTSLALATALLGASAVQAAPLSYTELTGVAGAWTLSGTTLSKSATAPTLAGVPALLAGNAAAPGANLELGLTGSSPATTLTGTGNGHTFTFSSLTYADWFSAPGVATTLTTNYILGAATEAALTLTSAQLTTAVARFNSTGAWALVSDPNLSYIDLTGDTLAFGLAGYLSVYAILLNLFPTEAANIPRTVQASEVVKVSIDGVSQYVYGFDATPTGLSNTVGNFSGNYAFALTVQPNDVPEPASLALVGVALAGLAAARRRKQG